MTVPPPYYGPPPGPPPYASPYAYPVTPPGAPTNSMAIASMVCAFLFAPLGIVFGHISLTQIRRTGEQGHGLALAGLVLSYLFTVLTLALFALPDDPVIAHVCLFGLCSVLVVLGAGRWSLDRMLLAPIGERIRRAR